MKKSIISMVAIIIIGYICCILFVSCDRRIESFNLEDYSDYISEFPSELVLGSIDNAEVAVKKAEEIWLEIYGKDILLLKPYIVSFDEENQVWLVTGSLPFYMDGGVPNILIQKSDGKVLAIWHDK